MRVPREKLILWSICVLYQRSGGATDAPMQPDFGIKLALAVVHALGCRRGPVDDYWKAMKAQIGHRQAAYIRGTGMRTQIEVMLRELEVDDPLFRHEMHEAIHYAACRIMPHGL